MNAFLWMWLLGAPLILAFIDLIGSRKGPHRTMDRSPTAARY
jgi:hypothetical protein